MGLLSKLPIRLPRVRSSNPKVLALSESAREIEAMESDLLVFFDDQLDNPVVLRNTQIAQIPRGTAMVNLEEGAIDMGGRLSDVLPFEKYELIPPGGSQPDSAEPVPDELVGSLPQVKPSVEELRESFKEAASLARV